VTDDKSLDKAERKRLQVEHAPKKTDAAKLIKLADKTSNVRAIAFAPLSASSGNRWTSQARRLVVRSRLRPFFRRNEPGPMVSTKSRIGVAGHGRRLPEDNGRAAPARASDCGRAGSAH
jgi:hypothetical protein